ncbi:TonB-dependent receptor plug domain-containing protein [Roseovarius amoyensis]|uniref:TonB-dependent receptor plug domain-containing protein n=1 Tax=Roseovarius amoyensis TaxID=2211448 RepID=UPI000DBE131B|nr:TonB-dependent receptor [Roseovarius amoyensis]
MKHSILAAIAGVTTIFTQTAVAEEAIELDPIIVSGGLSPVEAAGYGRSVTVMTGEEIKERGIATVQDALRTVPGLAISSSGGNYTEVRIRGAEANHTLILIDGVEAAGGDGQYILSGLDTANIERIEVLRGPQSVYYGSNASAGVINIITRTGKEGTEYGASFEAGTHGSNTSSAFASVRGARGGLSFSLSDNHDAGWDFSGDNGERDRTDRVTAILKGDIRLGDSVTLGFNLRRSDEHYEFDSTSWVAVDAATYIFDDPTQFASRDETTFSTFAEHEMFDGRAVHRLTYELTENEDRYNGGAPVKTRTEAYKYRLGVGLDGAAASAAHLINLLLEHEQDSSSTNLLYKRDSDAIALEYRGSFANGLDVQAGVRFEDNSVFSDATTWNLAASYAFDNGVRLHASAGTGVVNPTYFDLFAAAFGYTGNPNLRPEENESYDIGVEVPFMDGRGLIDVTYFNERLENEIIDVPTGPGTFTFANQVGTSHREGVEVESSFAATDLVDLRLSYTYLDAKNPNGTVEARRPKHELGLGVTARTSDGRASVSADIRHVADNTDNRYFPPFTPAKLPDYTLVNLSARFAVTDAVDATLRVENLLDESYSDVWGYAGRDRTIYVGFDANW